MRRNSIHMTGLRFLFQSTHLVWGATMTYRIISVWLIFQSTHLVWGATAEVLCLYVSIRISIHAPRVRCDSGRSSRLSLHDISIHAPRVRCDFAATTNDSIFLISIHAPRVRCDCSIGQSATRSLKFQSTHLVWGATLTPKQWALII